MTRTVEPRAAVAGRLRGVVGNAAPVGGGLVLVGLAAYVVLALAGHTLAPADYTAAANMFLITAIVGPGVFAAVEQQTNREVSARIAGGQPLRPVLRGAALVAAWFTAGSCALVLATSPLLVDRVFSGHAALVVATVVAVVGAAAAYLLRGVFGGQRRYRWYGVSLAGEGLSRLLPCAVLVPLGWASASRFGFVFAAGCGVAALVTAPGLRGPSTPPGAENANSVCSPRRLAGAVGYLAGASALMLLMTNLGPVVLSSRVGPAGAQLSASFVSLFMLARVPLFLFGPVQAFLLPTLTEAAQRRDLALVRQRLRVALLAVLAVGVPGVLCAWLVGPWATRVLFAAPIELPGSVAAALGVGTVAMMAAQVLQPALVALGRNRAATGAWMLAGAVFVGLLFTPESVCSPLVAAVGAQVVAPILVTVLMRAALSRVPAGQPSEATVTNSL